MVTPAKGASLLYGAPLASSSLPPATVGGFDHWTALDIVLLRFCPFLARLPPHHPLLILKVVFPSFPPPKIPLWLRRSADPSLAHLPDFAGRSVRSRFRQRCPDVRDPLCITVVLLLRLAPAWLPLLSRILLRRHPRAFVE
jgi:hypothetical protein